jgi:hypothetical protein
MVAGMSQSGTKIPDPGPIATRGARRCRRPVVAALLGLLLALLAPALAAAQPRGNPFTVRGVAVDETAGSVTQARDQALLVGQRKALNRLFDRLVVAADRPRLPQLPRNEMLRLVEGIQVADEKSSATRYIARLIVTFHKDRVRALLRDNGVRFAETQAKPALILPVLEQGGERLLFDDANPWRDAWLAQPPALDNLLPLVLPLGDLADVATIGPNDAAFGDERRIGQMAERYQVDSVLVALAELGRDYAVDRPTLDVSLRRYGGVGAKLLVERFELQANETVEAMLARAAATLTAGLEEDWKQETALTFDAEQRLSVQVPFDSFADWLTIRRLLQRNAMIRRVEVLSLRRSDAQIALEHAGLPSQLQVALAQDDLELRQSDGFWLLGRRGRLPGGVSSEPMLPTDTADTPGAGEAPAAASPPPPAPTLVPARR